MIFAAAILAAISVLPADRLAFADRLMNRGEYAAAKAEYAALASEPKLDRGEILYRLAESERALGENAAARGHYAEFIRTDPTSKHVAAARLMKALLSEGREKLDGLRALDSDDVGNDIRSEALYHLGTLTSDPELLARSLKLNPKGKYAEYAEFNRAALLAKSKRPDDHRRAREALSNIAFGEESRFTEEALFLAASLSYDEGRYVDAARMYGRYLKRYPKSSRAASARKMLAWSDYLGGRYSEATEVCEGRTEEDYVFLRGVCAYQSGDSEGARRLLKDYLEKFPVGRYRRDAELPLARLEMSAADRDGRGGDAVELSRRAYELSGAPGDALRYAWALEKAGRAAEAKSAYETVITKFRGTEDYAEALFRKAAMALKAQEWSVAEMALGEMLASGKGAQRRGEALYWRGTARVRLGYDADGASDLRAALKETLPLEEQREARLTLADLDWKEERYDAAKTEYAKLLAEGAAERMSASKLEQVGRALEGDPAKIAAKALTKSASAEWRQAGWTLLGELEEKSGAASAAIAAYRAAVAEPVKTERLASGTLALGRLEFRAGEYATAEKTLVLAAECNGAQPAARAEAYLYLAKNAVAKGETQAARGYATVIATLFDSTPSAAEAEKLLKTLGESGQ